MSTHRNHHTTVKTGKREPDPIPGFPWEGKFTTLEEIKEYLNEDKLTCLLCGRKYSMLTTHLTRGHHIDPDEYKERYRITWTSKLAGRVFREGASHRLNKRRAAGEIRHHPPREQTEYIIAAKKRPTNEAVRKTARNRMLAMHGRTEKWGQKDFEEYLRRIKSGRTLNEVGKDKDMPNPGMFYNYMRDHPEFGKRFEKIWDALPFAVQARGQKMGPRFESRVMELRRKGYEWKQIGRILKVNPGTACGKWVRMRKKGKLLPEDYVPPIIWSDADYEEFLRRVQSGRTHMEVSDDPDMPSSPCFNKYLNKKPEFKKRFEEIWEALPFEVQARGRNLGKRFKLEVVRLRLRGNTWPEVSRKLGVKESTPQTTWSKLKLGGQLESFIREAEKDR